MPQINTREQLILGGLQTLHLNGFNGTSVQDITEAAGVPKGSFYNHFESKQSLASEALRRFWAAGEQRRALLDDPNVDPVERLRRYFRKQAKAVIRDNFRRGCMIGNLSAEMAGQSPEIRATLEKLWSTWSSEIEACVRQAEAAGRIRGQVPAGALAGFLLCAWEGALLRAKVSQDEAPLEDFDRVIFDGLFT